MRNIKNLIVRDKLRRFAVIPPDLVNSFGNAFLFMSAFCLNDNHRNTVYKKDNIPPVCVSAIGVLPLVSNVESVTCNILKINQLKIYFAPFAFIINAFIAFKITKHVTIALNA